MALLFPAQSLAERSAEGYPRSRGDSQLSDGEGKHAVHSNVGRCPIARRRRRMTARLDTAAADLQRDNAELQRQLDACRAELAARNSEYGERIEHQSATIDVLKAMSASPGDPQPVFDLIVRRARDLCNCTSAGLFEFDGELVHWRSSVGVEAYATPDAMEAYKRLFPMAPTRGSITCRAILDRQTI